MQDSFNVLEQLQAELASLPAAPTCQRPTTADRFQYKQFQLFSAGGLIAYWQGLPPTMPASLAVALPLAKIRLTRFAKATESQRLELAELLELGLLYSPAGKARQLALVEALTEQGALVNPERCLSKAAAETVLADYIVAAETFALEQGLNLNPEPSPEPNLASKGADLATLADF